MEYIFVVIFSFVEGIREYLFYNINSKGGFPDQMSDKLRKSTNVVIAFLFYCGLIVGDVYGYKFVLELSIFFSIRWILLGSILNYARDLPAFYVESVEGTNRAIWYISKKIGINESLVFAICKFGLLGLFITLLLCN